MVHAMHMWLCSSRCGAGVRNDQAWHSHDKLWSSDSSLAWSPEEGWGTDSGHQRTICSMRVMSHSKQVGTASVQGEECHNGIHPGVLWPETSLWPEILNNFIIQSLRRVSETSFQQFKIFSQSILRKKKQVVKQCKLYATILFKLEIERGKKKRMWLVNTRTNTNKENKIKQISLKK